MEGHGELRRERGGGERLTLALPLASVLEPDLYLPWRDGECAAECASGVDVGEACRLEDGLERGECVGVDVPSGSSFFFGVEWSDLRLCCVVLCVVVLYELLCLHV